MTPPETVALGGDIISIADAKHTELEAPNALERMLPILKTKIYSFLKMNVANVGPKDTEKFS